MTNGEKFKTAAERFVAFANHCNSHVCCRECILKKYSGNMCRFAWLDLEYKEELKPCPFCGGEARIVTRAGGGTDYYFVECKSCFSKSVSYLKQEDAVAVWNSRV